MFSKLTTFSFLLFFSIALQSQSIKLYVGGYTNGDREGIYQFDFDTETGKLSEKKLVVVGENPSYIEISPDKNYLYSVHELSRFKGKTGGSVASYKISSEEGLFEKLSERNTYGKNPCHLSINKKGTMASASNYTGGNFCLYPIVDGKIQVASQIVNLNKGKIGAKTHSASFFKNNLFVANLGINTLEHYSYEKKSDRYVSQKSIPIGYGVGPRHFSITKNGKSIYVINELASTISLLQKEGKSYKVVQNYTTLTEGYEGKNSCADIHLSKNEKFLYGSNRGENTIVVYKRNIKDGSLEQIQNMSVQGNWPRNFVIDPTGKFLLVANKKSSNIAVFSIDKKTGMLNFLHSVQSENPSCLKF